MSRIPDVAVIGAGVFGAWIAARLQADGRQVAVIDQYGPANARASSGGATRVIRASYGADAIYTAMAQAALPQWKAMFARIGQPHLFRETGVLWIAAADDASARSTPAALARFGVPHELLDTDAIARRWPQFAPAPGSWAILEPQAGAVFARRAVQAVIGDTLRIGATLQIASVTPPHGSGRLDRLMTTSGEPVRAGEFVFACGPWLDRIVPDVFADRLFPTRQEVFYFGPPPGDARFASPALPTWLDAARGWYGIPDLDGRGFKLAHDVHGVPTDPDTQSRLPTAEGIDAARHFLRERFPDLADAPLVGAEVCQYENTSNGDFVIDRHPRFDNVWIAGGGSGHGFKHGPSVAEHLLGRMRGEIDSEPRFLLVRKAQLQRREVH